MPGHPSATGPSPDLADVVRAWDDARLNHLLSQRPDLAHPPPSSLTALATRAGARASLARALAGLNAPTITTLEAIVLLAETRPPTPADVQAAVGHDPATALAELTDLALIIRAGTTLTPLPALRETLGPHPLGLGPRLADLGVRLTEGWPTTARAVGAMRANAPEPARRMLDALTWGPPVGTVTHDIPPGARWLLDNHVLVRTSATELVLPREVAIAARGARLAPAVPAEPPVETAPVRPEESVLAESARAAEEVLERIEALTRTWTASPVSVLRSGGVGVRELRQSAAQLGLTTAELALVVELAAMSGLLGHRADEEGSFWTATVTGEDWALVPLTERWAQLVLAWSDWSRTPWLAGTRTDRGALRSVLEPDLQRNWAPVLRRRVLRALAQWPAGAAPSPAQVRAHLAWHTAKAVPPLPAIEAILNEAAALGITGAGALTPAGRLLVAGSQDRGVAGSAPAAPSVPAEPSVPVLAAELEAAMPPAVAEMIIQGDLTAVVPGRPSAELRALIEQAAEVESRGPGMTVRFTAPSVRRALTGGSGAEDLLTRLGEASLTPVPQPLAYLVRDVARSHGSVRVGAAGSYLRSGDPDDLARLLAHPELTHLGLASIAPTVLTARASAREVAEALAEAGLAGVLEGPDGEPLTLPAAVRAAVRAVRPGQQDQGPIEEPGAVVALMRAGEERARDLLQSRSAEPGAPADTLEALRLAASRGADVELVMAGAHGGMQSRVVRPLTVDSGRIRVLDVRRDAEITVAAHRIAAVRPVPTSG